MTEYIAVVRQSGGVIEKYQVFDNQSDAEKHVADYGGFCCQKPSGAVEFLVVDEANKTVTFDSDAENSYMNDLAMSALRSKRNALLNKSDWSQFPDCPLSSSDKTAWATYRQELRDLPSNTADPQNPSWPVCPGDSELCYDKA